MPVSKPTPGATGWNVAVDAVIDIANAVEDLPTRVDALEAGGGGDVTEAELAAGLATKAAAVHNHAEFITQDNGDNRYILQTNADTFAPAEATTTALAGKAAQSANLSDLASVAAARTNLGLAALAATGKIGDATDLTTAGAAPGQFPAVTQVGGSVPAFGLHWPAAFARGPRLVFLGDSTTIGGTVDAPIGGAAETRMGNAWPFYAALESEGRIQVAKNAGIYGNTTTQMLARFDADVATYTPDVVTIMGGRNDGIDTFTTYQANIAALVAKVRGIGALPVLCTPLPTSDATHRQKMATWTKWVRRFSIAQHLPLIDFYALAADTSGGFLTTFGSLDGTHPEAPGMHIMGVHAAEKLTAILPPFSPNLPVAGNDTDNLIGEPLFLGGQANGTVVPWARGSTPTWATYSIVTVPGWAGKAQQIDATSTTGGGPDAQIRQNITPGPATAEVGDELEFIGRIDVSSVSLYAYARLLFEGPSKTIGGAEISTPSTGVFRVRTAVPAGTTSIRVQLLVPPTAVGPASVRYGQLGLYNLTKLGIL